MSDDQPTQSTSSFQQQPPKSDKSKARDKGASKGTKKAAKAKGKEVKDEPEELNKLAEAYVSYIHSLQRGPELPEVGCRKGFG